MTDYGVQLVQKLYGNPFYLSPLYKPKPDDIRAQAFYDVSITFMNGAKELNDTLKNLEVMRSKPMSPSEARGVQRAVPTGFAAQQAAPAGGRPARRGDEGRRPTLTRRHRGLIFPPLNLTPVGQVPPIKWVWRRVVWERAGPKRP